MAFNIYNIGFVLLLLFISLLLLGGWPALWKYLSIKGRNSSHTLMDYGMAYLFIGSMACIIGASIEQAGGTMPSFAEQARYDSGGLVGYAIGGGIFLALGDMALQYAISLIGVTLAPSIMASCVNVVAITANYFIDKGLNDPRLVFPGLACSITAILLGSLTQYVHERTTGEVNHLDDRFKSMIEAQDFKVPSISADPEHSSPGAPQQESDKDCAVDCPPSEESSLAPVSSEANRRTVLFGLIISIASGCLTGLFVPAFNIACNDSFHQLSAHQQPMSIYVAALYFVLAAGVTVVIVNLIMFRKPFPGTPRSSVREYLADNKHRLAGVGAGALVTTSNVFQFAGGQYGGYAASMLSGAFPLITTVLGILLFKEFRTARRPTVVLLVATCLFYVLSIVLLGLSARSRES